MLTRRFEAIKLAVEKLLLMVSVLSLRLQSLLEDSGCMLCRKPVEKLSSRECRAYAFCDACWQNYKPLGSWVGRRCYALLEHNPSFRQVFYGYKFYKKAASRRLLVALLARELPALLNKLSLSRKILVVISIPPRKGKPDKLGVVVRQVCWQLGLRYQAHVLSWQQERPHQHHLRNRQQRLLNMERAFTVNTALLEADTHYLIIDDLRTTGATLQAALAAFEAASVCASAVALGQVPRLAYDGRAAATMRAHKIRRGLRFRKHPFRAELLH